MFFDCYVSLLEAMWYSVCRCVQDTYPSIRAQTLWPYFTWCHHLLWLFSNFITELCWLWCHHHHHHHHHHPSISIYIHLYPYISIYIHISIYVPLIMKPFSSLRRLFPRTGGESIYSRRFEDENFREKIARRGISAEFETGDEWG